MKLQALCPYCEGDEFGVDRHIIYCETCGEIMENDYNVKKLEEN